MLFDLRRQLVSRTGSPIVEERKEPQEDGTVRAIKKDLMIHELIAGALLADKKDQKAESREPINLGEEKQHDYNLAVRVLTDGPWMDLCDGDVERIKQVVAVVCNVLATGQIYNILSEGK